jgi:glycosyltransferase involved in cell wall biosynthesis
MYSNLKVLLLLSEFPFWRAARHLSYSAQLGIEDGLRANGVNPFTVTSLWFPEIAETLSKRRFDQIWVVGRPDTFDETSLERLVDVAPVRLAMLADSLDYSDEEYQVSPSLKARKSIMESRIRFMTHIVSCDEKDAETIRTNKGIPGLWWPQAVPQRFISDDAPTPSRSTAVFLGAAYGLRRDLLRRADLRRLLSHPRSPESATIYPTLFNALHLPLVGPFGSFKRRKESGVSAYLTRLRHLRIRCFEKWLAGLQSGYAVVNLPHLVKTYAGRVVEGMAAGRPVVSWAIPDRPYNQALFEDGKEILLFPDDDSRVLIAQLERLLHDRDLHHSLVRNARKKIREFHTLEIRIRQILDWIIDGRLPRYC